jgi:hypothetical protein
MDEQTNSPPAAAPAYDFRTERVADLDAGQVEMELSNLQAPGHPYSNVQDPRHDLATQYGRALHERNVQLRPETEPLVGLLAESQREQHRELDALRSRMDELGFDTAALPDWTGRLLQPWAVETLKRDIQLGEGDLAGCVTACRDDLRTLPAADQSVPRALLETIENLMVAGAGDPERDRASYLMLVEQTRLLSQALATVRKERFGVFLPDVTRDQQPATR